MNGLILYLPHVNNMNKENSIRISFKYNLFFNINSFYMKHNFKTLFILITICLPWGIFAQKIQLPDYLPPYVPPHQSPISQTQERNEKPVLLLDSMYCASLNPQTNQYDYNSFITFEYDLENRISSYVTIVNDPAFGELQVKYTDFYNSNGLLTMSEGAIKEAGIWIVDELYFFTYDSNNYRAEVRVEYPASGESTRDTYINNADGFILESRDETLINGLWILNNKTTYSRNTDNQPTLKEQEIYNSATGVILYKNMEIYEYDAAGNITLKISRYLDLSTSEWINSAKEVNTYTSNNLIKSFEKSSPSSSNPALWTPKTRTEYSYFNQIELDSLIKYNWNGNNWQPLSLQLHQYNNGQVIKDSSYVWLADQWNLQSRQLYKLGDDFYSISLGISESIEIQKYENGIWETTSITQEEYTDLGNNLVKLQYVSLLLNNFNVLDTSSYCNAYYHRIFPVSTNETLNNKSTTIAPNPYKTGQTIRCIGLENSTDLTFSLYDLAGALISEQNFDGGRGLVLPAKVGAGMYIAVIRQGTQRLKTTKIVVVDAP